MIYSSTTRQPTYRCMNTHADPDAACHKFKVATNEVEDAVITVIKVQAGIILESDDLTGLRKAGGSNEQLAEYENQIMMLAEQRQTVYEQFVTGEIDRETYRNTKSSLTTQIDKLKNMVAMIKQSEHDSHAMKDTAEQAKAVLSESLAPQEIVDALIDKVCVFPDDHIEIAWKVAGFSAV